MAMKQFDVQAVMNTHLSHPTGAGAFGGQQGMSLAISSLVAADISSVMACIESARDAAAIAGPESGANARPAITRIASVRRMAKLRFTWPISHRPAAITISRDIQPALILIKLLPTSWFTLSVRATDYGHQFGYFLALIGLVAACDRVFDAMRHVILQHFFLDAPQRGPHRGNLGDDVDAVAIVVNHLGQAADLAFDPAETLLAGCLDVFSHPAYIPLLGMGCKADHGETR
jgi:hypothetical protein